MTREEIIDFCEMKSQLEPENEDIFNYIIKALEQEPCEDCVSRQAVIDYAKDTCIDLDKYEDTAVFCDEIKALPSVTPTQKWIPVSERLPEEKGFYLVSVKNEHNRRYSKSCWFYGNGNWFARQEVIAWMPLSEPYKVESE